MTVHRYRFKPFLISIAARSVGKRENSPLTTDLPTILPHDHIVEERDLIRLPVQYGSSGFAGKRVVCQSASDVATQLANASFRFIDAGIAIEFNGAIRKNEIAFQQNPVFALIVGGALAF